MPSKKAALNTEIQELYRQPLEEFTNARNSLASRLRKEDRKEDAAEVKALAKPTPSAWAVNALFERQPEKMAALLAAGQKARAAQREAVSGRGAEALREAIRTARGLSDELRWEAGQFLAEKGGSPSRTMIERIAANLQALAFSPAATDEAERGWLDRDLDPPGFEVMAGLQVAGAPVVDLAARREARRQEEPEKEAKKEEGRKPAPPPPAKASPAAQRSAHEARRQEARRQLDEAEKARREREAEKHRLRVAAAKAKLEDARIDEAALFEEAQKAEKIAAEARRQADAAEKAAAKARESAEKAAERLAKAEEELRAVKEDL